MSMNDETAVLPRPPEPCWRAPGFALLCAAIGMAWIIGAGLLLVAAAPATATASALSTLSILALVDGVVMVASAGLLFACLRADQRRTSALRTVAAARRRRD